MKTVKINIDWRSMKSIKRAEKDKLALENKGYTQINSFGGINKSTLIYSDSSLLKINN